LPVEIRIAIQGVDSTLLHWDYNYKVSSLQRNIFQIHLSLFCLGVYAQVVMYFILIFFIFYLPILLVCRGYIVTFTYVLTMYLNKIHPLTPFPPFIEQFQQILLFYFHTWYKVHQPCLPFFTLSVYLPPPTGTHALIRAVLLSWLSFLSGGFSMVFHAFIFSA
jgi:hypothetical protein